MSWGEGAELGSQVRLVQVPNLTTLFSQCHLDGEVSEPEFCRLEIELRLLPCLQLFPPPRVPSHHLVRFIPGTKLSPSAHGS